MNWLRCFVANCSVDLLSDFSRNLAHIVRGPGVFLNLAKNFLITIAARDEIAVSSNIPTTNSFCHDKLPSAGECSTDKGQGKVN